MRTIPVLDQTTAAKDFGSIFSSIAARRDVPLELVSSRKPSALELRAHAIDERVAAIDRRLSAINERLAALNQSAASTIASAV